MSQCLGLLYLSLILFCGGEENLYAKNDQDLIINKEDISKTDFLSKISTANLLNDEGIHSSGFSEFKFKARDGRILRVYVYRATKFDSENGPIWFVMHGASRDAQGYLQIAASIAERYQALSIAIEFSKENYPKGDQYTLGVTKYGRVNEYAYKQGRWRNPEEFLYIELERVFLALISKLNGHQQGYFVFGHSAGAQFTHRLITFNRYASVVHAVAANSGWYTLPLFELGKQYALPYGLRGSPLSQSDVKEIFSKNLTILVGTEDTKSHREDALLRHTSEAMTQGKTRYERGLNYFNISKRHATSLQSDFVWRLAYAPGAGHKAREVMASAAFLMFSKGQTACKPSAFKSSDSLQFSEILIHPPRDDYGDSNADGERSAIEDEFIEIKNIGELPVCLTGWKLEDGHGRGGHLFPIGSALNPGEMVVVFGGGIPTGNFGNSEVYTASSSSGLNLTNKGDKITLKDLNNTIVNQVSWGNCAGLHCADEHIALDKNSLGSVVNNKKENSNWQTHSEISNLQFSPGF